jgi:eukaryotic-like serine/threonine-protein kinase
MALEDPPAPEEPSAVELADLILLAMLRGRWAALFLEPAGDGTTRIRLPEAAWLAVDTPTWEEHAGPARLPVALGDAVVARLMLLGGLDVAAPEEQLGRLRVCAAGAADEILLAAQATPQGLSAELRRLARAAALPGGEGMEPRAGGYTIHREIGRGSVGIVYRAEHKGLGRQVALKVLKPERARDPVFAGRFLREAFAASRARHPGIVDVLDFGTLPDGRAFLVMELVEGETLRGSLAAPLPPARALEIARQLAEALAAIHAAGVVHRDLKPSNIFVGRDGRVKIGDFGAAKDEGPGVPPDLTQPGELFGTPLYMSPEHARGMPLDGRTDLYALGCILYEMLAGSPPYRGKSAVDILLAHISAAIPEVTSPHGALPAGVSRVVERALAKRVEDRYQTAAALAEDLGRVAAALGRRGWRRWLPI